MSTNNDGWILISERKPTQFPVWLYDGEATDGFKTWMHCNGGIAGSATHWKPAAADIPAPPKEPTQAQKDTDACDAWYNREWPKVVARYTGSMYPPPPFNTAEVWRAALAYERAEVGKMLPPVRPLVSYGTGIVETERAIEAIRARCGGGK